MSGVKFTKVAQPSNPSSGQAQVFYNSADSKLSAVDESGNVLQLGGFATKDYRLVRVLTYTSGNNTYTPTVGTKALYVEGIAGGAQGGGAATSSSQASVGGGGGAGAYSAVWLTGAAVTGEANFAANVGAAGSGAAAGATGNSGSDTVFTGNTTVTNRLTAKGGTGGAALAAGTSVVDQVGGAGGVASSGTGDTKIDGQAGGTGARYSGTQAVSGDGGNSVFGGGGRARVAVSGGVAGSAPAASAYGAGGSGAATTTTAQAGGAGIGGWLRIWEFA
jgi:hypothetical protein